MGYLANFMVYTFAMVGIIAVALLVFKNSTSGGCMKKSKYLKIVDSMSLGARKTLYIVSTGREKFLIASDIDKTSLISKLETLESLTVQNQEIEKYESPTFKETMEAIPSKSNYMDKSYIGIKSSIMSDSHKNESSYTSVMRKLAEKIQS